MKPTPFVLKDYIPFISDYGFKVTFGNEKNTLFLRRALQALIGSPLAITEISFDKNTIEGMTKKSRGGVLDIFCLNQHGEVFIVEMQLDSYPEILQRLKFYAGSKVEPWVKRGEFEFQELPKVYAIGILGFDRFSGDEYYRTASIRDDHGRDLNDRLTFIFVELKKFHKVAEECLTDLDKMIFLMNEVHERTELPEFAQEDWLATALHELNTRGMSPEQYSDLNIKLAQEMSERHRAANAEKWAKEQGFNKGREEGREEGKVITQKENIRRLILQTGADDATIISLLNVPLAWIQEVRQAIEAGR